MPTTDRTPPAGGRRLILFGAFDRHNFGDLLLAHCAAASAGGHPVVFAGLAARNLEPFGGLRTLSLAEAVATYGDKPADFVHVGGEVLTTTAWEAAVMLQSRPDAAHVLALHDRNPESRRAWAAAVLGTDRRIPYVADARDLPRRWRSHFRAVGGVALDTLPADARNEVLGALCRAERVSVRDRRTLSTLQRAGVDVQLARDPVAELPSILGDAVRSHAARGEIATLLARKRPWIAIQLAAHWGNDATLDRFAELLGSESAATAADVVLFRAGLAPWHDDLDTLQRLALRLRGQVSATILESAHAFDICALLAHAAGFIGTSLHGWIVANAFGVPASCLVHGADDKAASYLDTWSPAPRRWRTLDEDAPLLPRESLTNR